MEISEVYLRNLSALTPSVSSALDGLVMVAKFEGNYRDGSTGNGDGLFMAATLAAHFAVLEPFCLVLDLRALRYRWGNTILKAINFFYEYGRDSEEKNKGVIIVASGTTRQALDGLEKTIDSGRRIYFENLEDALVMAEREAKAFLKCDNR